MTSSFPPHARSRWFAHRVLPIAAASLVLLRAVESGAAVAPSTTATTPAAVDGVEPTAASTKLLGLATDGVAAVPAAKPAEKRAAALAADAMNKDFLGMTYDSAEKKLRRAVEICLAQQGCSVRFLARLHRDIGVIYIVGMNRIEDGKDEFTAALSADATVAIAAESNTEEVEKAFLEVKRALAAENQPRATQPGTNRRPESAEARRSAQAISETAPAPGADAWREVANWISFGVQLDFLVHTSTNFVCNNSRYRCYDGQNQPQDYTYRDVVKGNEISSSGVRPGTLRLLFGYERLLSKNFSVGLKLGMVIAGQAPRIPGDPPFVIVHAEGRLTLYPGAAPFAPTRVARPYVFLSGGIAEVDGKISVEVYERNQLPARVLAWKRSGKGFLGLGFGSAFTLGRNHGPFIEAQFMRMLEKPSVAAAMQAGYAIGF